MRPWDAGPGRRRWPSRCLEQDEGKAGGEVEPEIPQGLIWVTISEIGIDEIVEFHSRQALVATNMTACRHRHSEACMRLGHVREGAIHRHDQPGPRADRRLERQLREHDGELGYRDVRVLDPDALEVRAASTSSTPGPRRVRRRGRPLGAIAER